ncbi:MAG: saccharopine dehydrogenase NADP-binding domain-containing protein [Cyclobacteriaceae bacterium]|nr:saccharopine dehydrogenase NADP-binding domain-containing protein [Cyclobacteriaceae bacterium]
MKDSNLIVVYGSYGYTGSLIVNLCKEKKLNVLLAGRNAEALTRQSKESGFAVEVVESNDSENLIRILKPAKLVIHCGGPFKHTAKFMSEACLATSTHYTDITGEYQVFESLAALDVQAKSAGIMVMPGTGFDVVPSDCLAAHLKRQLPDATHLQLAFATSSAGTSRGTKKTSVEGLGYPSLIRENGELIDVPLGSRVVNIDFGPFRMNALNIPWGDIATAWRSTRIPNIEVYMGANESMIRNAKMSNYIGWLLRQSWVKNYMMKKIDQRPPGPSQKKREGGRSFLWGKVWNSAGTIKISRLDTLSGYSLTAETAVLIAEKILKDNLKPGYQTPSMAYGADLIMEITGTNRVNL